MLGLGLGLGLNNTQAPAAFAPGSIASLKSWLDASFVYTDAGTTLATSNDQLIRQWTDQSGNANHGTQSVSAQRGLFRVSDGPNSRPCVEFFRTTTPYTYYARPNFM